MHLFSHLVIARELRLHLAPQNLGEYYWGAIAADIRYAAGLPRRQTHRPLDEVFAWLHDFPDYRDFALGCRVHALADVRDAAGFVYDFIPFRGLRRRLPRSLAMVVLESAYTEVARRASPATRSELQISGSFNQILAGWGVPEAVVEPFARAANTYIGWPSLASIRAIFTAMGGELHPRLAHYFRIAAAVEGCSALRNALLARLDLPALTQRIVADLGRVALSEPAEVKAGWS